MIQDRRARQVHEAADKEQDIGAGWRQEYSERAEPGAKKEKEQGAIGKTSKVAAEGVVTGVTEARNKGDAQE